MQRETIMLRQTVILATAIFLSVCETVCLPVCLFVCVSVCPAFTAYISLTMGRILIKLGENVETLVRLIV